MKVPAAAKYAGNVAEKTIYAAIRSGDLRAARIGAGRNVLTCDIWIDEWLQSSATPFEVRSMLREAGR
jgi:hypothetical protein